MATDKKIKKTGLGTKASRRISNAIVYIVLALITVVWLFPFFGLVMESFKVNTTAMDGKLIPEKFEIFKKQTPNTSAATMIIAMYSI